jgi:hypothetical protein
MVALSPRLLLEISVGVFAGDNLGILKDSIEPNKLSEFGRRTIGNTFREVIFPSKTLLESWQKLQEFKDRVEVIRKMKHFNTLVAKNSNGELWKINSTGNM